MPISTKRTLTQGISFAPNVKKGAKLDLGFLEENVSIFTRAKVTGVTGAIKDRASLVKIVNLTGDKNTTIDVAVGDDLIVEQMIYEQQGAAMLCQSYGTGTAGEFWVETTHVLPFREPFAGKLGDLTLLPTWIYQAINLELTFGSVADLTTNGVGALLATDVTVQIVQSGYLKYPTPSDFGGDTVAFGKALGKSIRGYDDGIILGAAPRQIVEIPRDADLRSIIVRGFAADGTPDNDVIESVTMLVNRTTAIYSEVSFRALRAENARVFGVQMPAGVAVLESAEDQDITDIFPVTGFSSVLLYLKTTKAGSFRLMYKKLQSGN
jgi:hypothetical protein